LRERGQRHALGVELAVAVRKRAQSRCSVAFGNSTPAGGGGGAAPGGAFSGPLMPQPLIVIANAPASTARRATGMNSRNIIADPTIASHRVVTTDTAFIAATERVLAQVGRALDDALAAGDADVDWNINDGILEIECGDGSSVIVNRHASNREIWVAARSGGFHFRASDGLWRDTRGTRELAAALTDILATQAGVAVALPMLRAP
jgi:CyaY protein